MGQRSIIILTILIIITVVFGVLFLVSRLLSGGGDEAPDNETEAVSTLTPAGNIVKDPVVYDNLTLEIESSITDWVTKNSFTLLAGGGGAFGGGKRQLYVVFDKNFKLFYGENDLCLRIKKTGLSVYHNSKVTIIHRSSQSVKQLPTWQLFQITLHDMLYYYRKHFGLAWWIFLWITYRANWIYWRLQSIK